MKKDSFYEYKLVQLKTEKHFSFLSKQIDFNSDIVENQIVLRQKVIEDCYIELGYQSESVLEFIEHWVNYYKFELKKIYKQTIEKKLFKS